MDKPEQFKKLQQLRSSVAGRPLMHSAADPKAVALMLGTESEPKRFTSFDYFSLLSKPEIGTQEARELIVQLEAGFESARLEEMLKKAQRDLIGAIAGPLGLGKVLAVHDKLGGNVDTIHNARQQVYATDEARQKYAEKSDYDSSKYHGDKRYIDKNAMDTVAQASGRLENAYTGEIMGDKHIDPRNLDHTIAAKEIHEDAGRILAGLDGAELANSSSNLNPTKERFNKFKGQQKAEAVVRKLQQESPERSARITELKSKSELTVKESNELELHLQKQAIADSPERLLEIDKTAREEYEGKLRDKYYNSNEFRNEVIGTSIKEAGKMGFQQVFGMLMVEFFSSAFDEIKQVYKHGQQADSMLSELSTRLRRVAVTVASKWEGLVKSFSGGFISGFISNAVTILINTFVTTGKRVVRLIREGVLSLLKAVKILLFPPKDLNFQQAAHEAMKLLAVGGVVVGGVALEESVEMLIKSVPFFAPFASVMTAVFVGAVTAFCMTFVCYLIDKMDLLGVIKAERDNVILSELDNEIGIRISKSQCIIEEIEGYLITT